MPRQHAKMGILNKNHTVHTSD